MLCSKDTSGKLTKQSSTFDKTTKNKIKIIRKSSKNKISIAISWSTGRSIYKYNV